MTADEKLNTPAPTARSIVEIRVRGHLDHYWADWLEGMQAESLENGETALTGPIVDQAALIGMLSKLARLNLTIVSVAEVPANRGGCVLSPPLEPTDD